MFDLSMGVTGYDIFIFLTHVKIFTKRTVGTAYDETTMSPPTKTNEPVPPEEADSENDSDDDDETSPQKRKLIICPVLLILVILAGILGYSYFKTHYPTQQGVNSSVNCLEQTGNSCKIPTIVEK